MSENETFMSYTHLIGIFICPLIAHMKVLALILICRARPNTVTDRSAITVTVSSFMIKLPKDLSRCHTERKW